VSETFKDDYSQTNQLKFVNYNVRIVYVWSAPMRYPKDYVITDQIMRATKERADISFRLLLQELPNDDEPHTHSASVRCAYAHPSAVCLLAGGYKISVCSAV
jgi:hypothetical protein